MPRDGHFVVNGIQERTAAEGEATEAVLGAESLAGHGGASGGKRGRIGRQAGAHRAASGGASGGKRGRTGLQVGAHQAASGGAPGSKRGCIRRQAGAPQAASEEPRVKRQTTPGTNPSGQ